MPKNPHGFDVRKANANFRRDNGRRAVVVRKPSAKASKPSDSDCPFCRFGFQNCPCGQSGK